MIGVCSQCIPVTNHHGAHLEDLPFSSVNYTSTKLRNGGWGVCKEQSLFPVVLNQGTRERMLSFLVLWRQDPGQFADLHALPAKYYPEINSVVLLYTHFLKVLEKMSPHKVKPHFMAKSKCCDVILTSCKNNDHRDTGCHICCSVLNARHLPHWPALRSFSFNP